MIKDYWLEIIKSELHKYTSNSNLASSLSKIKLDNNNFIYKIKDKIKLNKYHYILQTDLLGV